MRYITKFLLAALILTASVYTPVKAQPASNADTGQMIDRHLSGFNSIKIAGPFEVHLAQGPTESVKLIAGADVRDRITAEVTGGVLKIHNTHDNWGWSDKSWYGDKSVWHNHKKIVVFITAKNVDGITVSGSGGLTFNDGLAAPSLKLRVRGSGEILGKVEVKKLESRVSGSGNIKLSGSAESSIVMVRGSGKFTARNLVTVHSAAHVSGSGHAELNASDKVDAAVRGSGAISYTGAKTVSISKSGSGEVKRF